MQSTSPAHNQPNNRVPFVVWQLMHKDWTEKHPLAVPRSLEVALHSAERCWRPRDLAQQVGVPVEQVLSWQQENGPPGYPLPRPLLRVKGEGPVWHRSAVEVWLARHQAESNVVRSLQNERRATRPDRASSPRAIWVGPRDIAKVLSLSPEIIRDWATTGEQGCPPFDTIRTGQPGYGGWRRETIWPWVEQVLAWQEKTQHTMYNNMIRQLQATADPPPAPATRDLPAPLRKRKETQMNELSTHIQQDFERLGQTATHTDLASLADDYPMLLAHACSFDTLPDWLVTAADRLALAGFWHAFATNPDLTKGTTPTAIFARGVRGLWLHRHGALEDAIAQLVQAARSPLLPPHAQDFFALRNAGILQRTAGCNLALFDFEALRDRDGTIGTQARYWSASTAILQANFRTGLELLPEPAELPPLTGDYWLNIGYAYTQCAHTDRAIRAQNNALQHARHTGSLMAEGETLAYLAWAECWTNPPAATTHAHEAIRLTKQTGNLLDQHLAYRALAIATAGTAPDTEFQTALNKAESLAYRTGNRTAALFCLPVRAWHAALNNNTPTLEDHIKKINQHARSLDSGQHWTDIARAWLPGHTRRHAELAKRWEWLDSAEDTMRRWRQLLNNRRALAG